MPNAVSPPTMTVPLFVTPYCTRGGNARPPTTLIAPPLVTALVAAKVWMPMPLAPVSVMAPLLVTALLSRNVISPVPHH